MRTPLISGALVALLSGPAAADHLDGHPVAGAAVGGGTGAVVGGVLFGPVGAIIGGLIGAAIGAKAMVPDPLVTYVAQNPVPPAYYETNFEAGMTVPANIELHVIPDDPDYAYFYANGRAYIVLASSGEIVYSPGFALTEDVVAYVQAHPADPIDVDFQVTVGAQVPQNEELHVVEPYPVYTYAHFDGVPVVVDGRTRLIA